MLPRLAQHPAQYDTRLDSAEQPYWLHALTRRSDIGPATRDGNRYDVVFAGSETGGMNTRMKWFVFSGSG